MGKRRPTFGKLHARWSRHRKVCQLCRAAIRGARRLHRPCDVERYLYDLAERARVRELAREPA